MEAIEETVESSLDEGCAANKGMAIVCCCVAMASLVPVTLVQLRVIRRLPDPPGSIFRSKRIVTAKSAYRFGIPNGLLGLGSYGVTLILLIAADPSRPWVGRALRGKLLLDGTVAARTVRGQIKEFGRLCSWCLAAAVATAGVVYFARQAKLSRRA